MITPGEMTQRIHGSYGQWKHLANNEKAGNRPSVKMTHIYQCHGKAMQDEQLHLNCCTLTTIISCMKCFLIKPQVLSACFHAAVYRYIVLYVKCVFMLEVAVFLMSAFPFVFALCSWLALLSFSLCLIVFGAQKPSIYVCFLRMALKCLLRNDFYV